MAEKESLNETKLFSLAELHGTQKATGAYFTLTIIEGPDFGLVFQIDQFQTVIGRKEDDNNKPDIELNDERTSRRHIVIFKKPAPDNAFRLSVMDLGSKNGTYVNGQRLSQTEIEIKNSDKIQIGSTVLKYEVKDTFDVSFQERLYKQVTRDALTNLWNYNYAKQELERLLSLATRSKLVLSVLLLEIDLLDTMSETYGRTTSDSILRIVAQNIISQLSNYEIAARTNNNQILIILPEANMDSAFNTGENLRRTIEEYDFSSLSIQQNITVSISVAQYPICATTGEELIKQADEALYRSKQVGVNRIVKVTTSEKPTSNIFKTVATIAIAIILVVILLQVINNNSIEIMSLLPNKSEKIRQLYSGTVEAHEITVGSKIGGRITEVLVQDGQLVKAGDVIAKFDIAELLARQKLLQARLDEAKANLAKLVNGFRSEEKEQAQALAKKEQAVLEQLRNGPRPQEIAEAKADLVAAQADLANAESTFNRIDKVYARGYESKQQRDDAENKVNVAKARVDALKQRVSLLEEGTRKEEIKAAQERYEQVLANLKLLNTGTRAEDIQVARAQVEAVTAEIEELKVRILEGQVLSPSEAKVEAIDIRPGDIIPPGQSVAKLLENSQIWVKIYVPQTEIGKVVLDQKASISVDSFPSKRFSGYVEKVDEQAQFYPRNVQTRNDREHQVFGVKIHIDDKDGKLKSGMSADVLLEEHK